MTVSDIEDFEILEDLPLYRAARLGDIAALERLVAEGANVNALIQRVEAIGNPFGRAQTPLMIAAWSVEGATVETLIWLVKHGADPRVLSEEGATAAWYAAGQDGHWSFPHYYYPLSTEEATDPDYAERLRFLLDTGLDPQEKSNGGRSLLAEACRAGDPARVRLLLNRGASPVEEPPTVKEYSFQIPLFCAAESGSEECVQLLLDAGADVHEVTSSSSDSVFNVPLGGTTALMKASSAKVARLLIAAGARVDARDWYQDVLGHVLEDASARTEYGEAEAFAVAEVLLEAGVSLDDTDEHGGTRLYHAAFRHQAPVVEFLLIRGASCAPNNGGSTPLHAICWQGEHDDEEMTAACARIIRTLIAAGVPIEARDNEGRTPLHEAVGGDLPNSGAVRTLLQLGAQTDPVDSYGQTPLHLAATNLLHSTFACLEMLVDAGANPLLPDVKGHTPIDCAHEQCLLAAEYIAWYAPKPGGEDNYETQRTLYGEFLQDATVGHKALVAAAYS